MKNVKRVNICIPNAAILHRLKTTPTLKDIYLSRIQGEPKVGDNIATVNHNHFARLTRNICSAVCVEEMK